MRGWTTIDTWHRPQRGKGPLRELCLRCDLPVRRHPSWWRRRQRGLSHDWTDYASWLVMLAIAASALANAF